MKINPGRRALMSNSFAGRERGDFAASNLSTTQGVNFSRRRSIFNRGFQYFTLNSLL
jgi:hypothetical protein